MPELPDITVYLEALERFAVGRELESVRLASPFVLRSVEPPITAFLGLPVEGTRRLGKRIALTFPGDLFLVFHLMIAGRLRWKKRGAKPPGRNGLALLDFPNGTLLFTEAGTKRRASLYAVRGEDELRVHDPGGVDVMNCGRETFAEALARESHTLKRSLTDPRLFSGIGNAYSDEILFRARLSPIRQSQKLTPEEIDRLHVATRETLAEWTERLRRAVGEGFPDKVTAFHDEMAVHGRYRLPCPVCGSPVQRIVHAENESNYCARCQTGGKLLADRVLSRLLKQDWPRTLDELEELRRPRGSV